MSRAHAKRRIVIDTIGKISWGDHLCQFCNSKKDLVDMLIPYLTEGLKNNEFCMLVTSPPLESEEAKERPTKALPNLEHF